MAANDCSENTSHFQNKLLGEGSAEDKIAFAEFFFLEQKYVIM